MYKSTLQKPWKKHWRRFTIGHAVGCAAGIRLPRISRSFLFYFLFFGRCVFRWNIHGRNCSSFSPRRCTSGENWINSKTGCFREIFNYPLAPRSGMLWQNSAAIKVKFTLLESPVFFYLRPSRIVFFDEYFARSTLLRKPCERKKIPYFYKLRGIFQFPTFHRCFSFKYYASKLVKLPILFQLGKIIFQRKERKKSRFERQVHIWLLFRYIYQVTTQLRNRNALTHLDFNYTTSLHEIDNYKEKKRKRTHTQTHTDTFHSLNSRVKQFTPCSHSRSPREPF